MGSLPDEYGDEDEYLGNDDSEEDDVGEETSSNVPVRFDSLARPARPKVEQHAEIATRQQRQPAQRPATKAAISQHNNFQSKNRQVEVPVTAGSKHVKWEIPLEQTNQNVRGNHLSHGAAEKAQGLTTAQLRGQSSAGPLKSAMKAVPPQLHNGAPMRHLQHPHAQALQTDSDHSDDGPHHQRRAPGIAAMPLRTQPSQKLSAQARPVPMPSMTLRRPARHVNYAEDQHSTLEEEADYYRTRTNRSPESTRQADGDAYNEAHPQWNMYSPQQWTSQPREHKSSAAAGRGRGRQTSVAAEQQFMSALPKGRNAAHNARTTVIPAHLPARQDPHEDWYEQGADSLEDYEDESQDHAHPARGAVKPRAAQKTTSRGRAAGPSQQAAGKKSALSLKRKADTPESVEDVDGNDKENSGNDGAEYNPAPAKKRARQPKTPAPKTKATPARKGRNIKK
ncbi:hypothetical protein P389DRAFT_171883 [Cystobasidium minutum MCA 4210]|uniref:uncharacterized protein n=1 Tax=Cystobasidium minutum MCA 4210 TaxID=1397322 RepID=UPI0034CEAFAD|eukprot:jgi/Rhomi1/171883/fgenesh1_kg.4_\